tara:strand:+ start:3803 stop:4525 length:723 start_codon:yes stop_codon:yes gene_type:complete
LFDTTTHPRDDRLATSPQLHVAGAILTVLPEGAVWWAHERMLIVADLHFEKGSSFAARGIALPPYDTRATLARLQALVARWKPQRLVALGDSFHDRAAEARMDEADAAALEAMTQATNWTWITGNHDPAPPRRFAGSVHEELRVGPLTLRHEPQAAPATGELAGHLHPVAAVRVRGRRLRRRCVASDGTRAILPAFGAYAGGLNVLDEAYANLLPTGGFHAWMLGAHTVVPVAARRLEGD